MVFNQSICSCVKSGSKCNVIWDGEKGIINEFLGIFVMQHILRQELTFVSHGSRSHDDSHDSLARLAWLAGLLARSLSRPTWLYAAGYSCHYISLLYTCQLSRLIIRRESHACRLKTSISRRLTPVGQFLTPDWKMWVAAVLLDTISKNMLTQTHVRNENHV